VMTAVAVPPHTMVRLPWDASIVKLFVPIPARALIVLLPVGVPQPVQRS